ncbi:MAG: methionine aminotransferase [Acidobacteria bacterium]|nr:methionine aminotransferase [Acidobacteriota bacterium]
MDAPVRIDSRLPDVGVSIFAVMTRLANEHGAINLSQGFPDFHCDPALVASVHRYMEAGDNQYAPMPGVLGLREALAEKIAHLYQADYDPVTEITVTAGATEALFDIISAFVRPGDEVVLFEPCYDAYVPVVRLNGGTPRFVTLRAPGYRIDWSEVRRALSPRTRLLIVNSPHNPTGAVLDAADVAELAALLDGTNVVVLSDEVYEHIIFDGRRHESLARHAGLRQRTCVVSSFGKTYHTTGWKIGYVAAPQALTAEIQRVHQFVTFATNTPIQMAYTDVTRARTSYDDLAAFYEAKRDRFLELLAGSKFAPVPCHGTYFQILDYSAVSDEADAAFARRLLLEHGVASIPTSAFLYTSEAPRVLRFCFAKKDETLERAAERLRAV